MLMSLSKQWLRPRSGFTLSVRSYGISCQRNAGLLWDLDVASGTWRGVAILAITRSTSPTEWSAKIVLLITNSAGWREAAGGTKEKRQQDVDRRLHRVSIFELIISRRSETGARSAP